MGLFKKLQAKGIEREHEAVGASVHAAQEAGVLELEPGEQVEVTLTGMGALNLQKGALTRAVLVGPGVATRNFLVVLTDRRLLVLEAGRIGATVKGLAFSAPRTDVEITQTAGALPGWTDLTIHRADGSTARIKLNTPTWGNEARAICDSLARESESERATA